MWWASAKFTLKRIVVLGQVLKFGVHFGGVAIWPKSADFGTQKIENGHIQPKTDKTSIFVRNRATYSKNIVFMQGAKKAKNKSYGNQDF